MNLNELKIISCILAIFIFTNCGIFQDTDVAIPEINIDGFEQRIDTTFVNVNVTSNGTPLELIGIAHSVEADFYVQSSDQLVFSVSEEGIYQIAIPFLSYDSTYYFKAFVGDGFLYGESRLDSFTIPKPPAPTIPCSLIFGEFSVNNFVLENVEASWRPSNSTTNPRIKTRWSTGVAIFTVNFIFNETPLSGTYYTEHPSDLSDGSNQVAIDYIDGNNPYAYVLPGAEIYIENIEDKEFILSVCSAEIPLNNGSNILNFSGQFKAD